MLENFVKLEPKDLPEGEVPSLETLMARSHSEKTTEEMIGAPKHPLVPGRLHKLMKELLEDKTLDEILGGVEKTPSERTAYRHAKDRASKKSLNR